MSRFFGVYGLLAAVVAATTVACSSDDEAPATVSDAEVTDGTPGDGSTSDAGPDAQPDAEPGLCPPPPEGESPEAPIEDRCPDGQAGTYMLMLYPDRVDIYRQRDFNSAYECEFLALAANGITNAAGIVRGEDGMFYVLDVSESCGEVFAFDSNGAFVGRVEANANLAGAKGLWPTFGDDFVAWSGTSSNLYELTPEAHFRRTYTPPAWRGGSRVEGITDILFVAQDRVLVTFSDRPAKLFAAPNSPDFPDDQVGPANAVTGIETPEGIKILMTAQIGGAGNGYGVVLYRPAQSGRTPPEQERILVSASEIVDGIDILGLRGNIGFAVLDSGLGGTPSVSFFDVEGTRQDQVDLGGEGEPIKMLFENVLPDL